MPMKEEITIHGTASNLMGYWQRKLDKNKIYAYILEISEDLTHWFPYWLYKFWFPPPMYVGSYSTFMPEWIANSFVDHSYSDSCKMKPQSRFNLHFLYK